MKNMWVVISLSLIGIVAVAAAAVLVVSRIRLDKENAELVQELLSKSDPAARMNSSSDSLADLPEPVRKYLENAIPAGQEYAALAQLEWSGEFRLGDQTASWKQFGAVQTFTVGPPGFVWDASISMAPLISARVIDSYVAGEGLLRAKIASAITVAEAEQSAELDSAELIRYLAETVWFPTALMPGQSVEWTPVDDLSAMATLNDQGNSVSLVFYFNDAAEVESVHTDGRFRDVDGDLLETPWTGYFENYERRDGILVPTDARVEWNLPDTDLSYWRGHLDKIEFVSG